MEINIWDIFRYVFKWKYLIITLTIIAAIIANWYAENAQTYSAELVIRYMDPNVAKGLNPNDEEFDVYEIISPSIVLGAISDLGIKSAVESIRRNIIINPIIPEDEEKLKEYKTKAAEEYTYYPTDFSIRYTVGSDKSGAYARDVLDAIMTNYYTYYSEKYLTQTTLPEIDYNAKLGEHDYLEIADSMNNKLTDFIVYLDSKVTTDGNYRSPISGMTFLDLQREYTMIKNNDMPTLFSFILGGKITVDEETLIKKYHYKINDLTILSDSKQEETNLAFDLMKTYAENNRNLKHYYTGNDENKVDDPYYSHYLNPAKATYDTLVDRYVKAGVTAENLRTDKDHAKSMIDIFTNETPLFENTPQAVQTVKSMIENIDDKLNKLYNLTDETIRGYNDYQAGKHITALSSANIKNTNSSRIFTLIAVTLGLGLGVIFAIAFELLMQLRKNLEKKV